MEMKGQNSKTGGRGGGGRGEGGGRIGFSFWLEFLTGPSILSQNGDMEDALAILGHIRKIPFQRP